MHTLTSNQPVPIHTLAQDELVRGTLFGMARLDGQLTYPAELLTPHRKAYYLLVFVRRGSGRHWVDMLPYTLTDNTVYVSVPGQLIVKEEAEPVWSSAIAFTDEFLALQENAALRSLPLIQKPATGHELRLAATDVLFVEDILDKLHAEHDQPGEWQHRLLTAYLTVLLTYLSRLQATQLTGNEPSAERLLLTAYQASIEAHFRELHEVSDYAALLNLSAGHLSEVVKTQSGRPASKHVHERLVLEAKRLLFHTQSPLKEIAFGLGFSDASYFNRFFKREVGLTPAAYRINVREMYQ